MLTYEAAKTRWEKSRKHKVLGVKVATNVYMKYAPVNNTFVLREVQTQCKQVPDPLTGRTKYVRVPPAEWGLAPIAEISPHHTTIIRALSNSKMEQLFGVRCEKPSSNKLAGYVWKFGTQSITCESPVIIDGGILKPVGGVTKRTINKALQKEHNKLIADVRKKLKIRAKLGAFDKIDMREEAVQFDSRYGKSIYSTMRDGLTILKILRGVNDSIESFYPVVAIAHHHNRWSNNRKLKPNIWEAYDALIIAVREKIRVDSGEVTYV